MVSSGFILFVAINSLQSCCSLVSMQLMMTLTFCHVCRNKLNEWLLNSKHCYSRCSLRDLCVCCWFGIDELSPEAPWPLIQSACLHIHCFLALMYYMVQVVVVCAVTAWIKLCHSHFTAAAVLFSGCSETLRGEDISLICQLWSLYLTVDWVRQDEGRLDFTWKKG